ncbi:hypothetical protein BDF20DRAFT_900302 [Mycotypha africana]|uniref:uncharacterized protein n=1 Tax=Mycotypha africana TaxID=64632 RepID=UPI0022FFFF45|nr:uncharacterized protein BDF20DRAFT_900302 [Mycotypha africana]KAI8967613.1 hypothetical protein BDF20DRAFT_900302 [Mycotypha africana]
MIYTFATRLILTIITFSLFIEAAITVDKMSRNKYIARRQNSELEMKLQCSEQPACPDVVIEPCPNACVNSCIFLNPDNPCCPYSGQPFCLNQ